MRSSYLPVATPASMQLNAWRERVRDPSLTALLIIQLCVIFVAAPLAALGLPWARPVGEGLVLGVSADRRDSVEQPRRHRRDCYRAGGYSGSPHIRGASGGP